MHKPLVLAFTLVELLISMAILSMLTTVVLLFINPTEMRNRAQDAVRREDVAVISGAMERYYADNNQYPSSMPSVGNAFTNTAGTITYLNEIPADPDGNPYTFSNPSGNTQTFQVCAALEVPPGPFCIENAF